MDYSELLRHVDHTLLTPTATWASPGGMQTEAGERTRSTWWLIWAW